MSFEASLTFWPLLPIALLKLSSDKITSFGIYSISLWTFSTIGWRISFPFNPLFSESIILGCTAEFGLYRTLQEDIVVPVIDPSLAALKKAEYHANLKHKFNLIPSRKWSCESPSEKEIEKFGLFKDENPFGNRIIIK